MAVGRHLEKWIWCHNSADGGSILTRFCSSMQNDALMTKIRSKSKPEIEFQYGTVPEVVLFQPCIKIYSPKFGVQIDFHLLKWVQSPNLNPEVDFRLYGRHLEKSIYRHKSCVIRPITTKFGRQMHSDMQMTIHRSNRNRK